MTRTEKVREVLNAVLRDYGLMNEMIEANKIVAHPFTVGPSAVTEALSLLDGCVIVPKMVTDDMCNAFLDEIYSAPTSQQVWSAMIAASEEGE